GELEGGARAAVGKAETGVAALHFLAGVAADRLLAPGRDQRDAEQVFEKEAVRLVVLDDIGVVMQPQRRAWERRQGGRGCGAGLDRVHEIPPSTAALTGGAKDRKSVV